MKRVLFLCFALLFCGAFTAGEVTAGDIEKAPSYSADVDNVDFSSEDFVAEMPGEIALSETVSVFSRPVDCIKLANYGVYLAVNKSPPRSAKAFSYIT